MSENKITLIEPGFTTILGDGYLDEYPATLEEHLALGLSFDSFVGVVCEDIEVIQGWLKKYPEFAKAHRIGEAKARLFYERLGIQGMMGVYRGFNANVFKFMVEERFKMGKPEAEEKGRGGGTNLTIILPDNGRDNGPRILESQTLNALVEDVS